ncbi:MAG: alpha/beta hydrolase [Pacificimonas sp.]
MPAFSATSLRTAMTKAARSRTFDMSGVTTSALDLSGMAGRLYTPATLRTDIPLVYFHGGGFLFGDLESHDRLCCRLSALMGVRVLSADYRLAPAHPPPAQLEDALAACRWVLAGNIGAHDRVMVGGDSAGGYLAARCALELGRDAVSAEFLLYPLIQLSPDLWRDRTFGASRWAGRVAVTWMAKHGLDREYPPLAMFDLGALPPTVISTGDWFDPVSPDAAPFVTALEEAGVPVRSLRDAGLVHGEFCIPDRSPRAERVLARIAAAADDLGLLG